MNLLSASVAALAGLLAATGGAKAEIVSEYTEIDAQKTCSVFDVNEEGGEFANLACAGWRGYPVLIYSADLRESLFYGFPPPADIPPIWESFSGFNASAPTVEWRIEKDGERAIPFATIQRRFVSDGEDASMQTQVLVVSKVGQVGAHEGCTVGLVLASGNPGANEMARRIADEQARDFACGADERVLVGEPMPEFVRQ